MQLQFLCRTYRLLPKTVYGIGKVANFHISVQALRSSATRNLCSKPMGNKETQDAVKPNKALEWTPIYHFPMIETARIFNRLKLYQSIFTGLELPLSVVFYCNGMTDFKTVMVLTISTTVTCFTLYVVTSFFKRLIGTIFIDREKKNLTIAHLTFWGNRKIVTVPVDEIIPLTDGDCDASDAFVKLHRFNTDEVLYLTLRFGKILKRDIFQKVFGNFENLNLKK